ncbi:23S rRNA (adenine(2030)-N(6))-methyltransferase RlmJ [Microvirga tunisiensis]|uniref:Ribosomal RNA large subunit methyltransferase J n=1 Tax=Pannonibacter tanglangensis TaxID=2750084 RepID=A0A7X5J7Z4_9HYPH|nr:23S rRNA (adenine(2030)-N(6))-methyltransferase RlmJ [Pannonibacter sp. XCT-53]NBN76936.1 23S rRNA (adenine(2030)-N(6))-methyltransferase RlmJ [Pannonibacter sp. XCT-53]
MNYRHAYHAGNIGDVLKHAVLAACLTYLKRKDQPFRVIDTHAGIGAYPLALEEMQKTGEWQRGIGRVLAEARPDAVARILAPWLEAVAAANPAGPLEIYPGSPMLARMLMRPQDRLTLTELHPADHATLAGRFAGDWQVKVIHLDGWLALGSFVPPKEKRGLVLIDPAFEVTDEFERIADGLVKAWKRWTNGMYLVWYPLKDRKGIDRFHRTLEEAGVRDVLTLELSIGRSDPDSPMRGSGMTLVNAPYTLADDMRVALPWLRDVLGEGPDAEAVVRQIIPE